jgi:hypothetical protein
VSNYLPIFYFAQIFAILVVLKFTIRIVFLFFSTSLDPDRYIISDRDKIYLGVAISYIITFIKFN